MITIGGRPRGDSAPATHRNGREQQAVPVPGEELVSVRIWDLPVRVIHWGLVTTILVLSVTGLYIGNPSFTPLGQHLTMAWIKLIHWAAGLIFIALLLARFIWMFTGNKYARYDQFVPVRRERRALIAPSIKYSLFMRREPPPAAGHNPLAGLTYTVLLLMLVVEAVTGLALKALEYGRTSMLWTTTHWVFDIASIPTIRLIHHLILWLTVGFVVHHVYSAVLVDREERSGLLSSIVTGYKTLPRDRL